MAAIDRTRLEAVLEATGPAHHAAFAETAGYDPEWAMWYARHTIAELREVLLRPDLTESRLVWAFVSADDAHSGQTTQVPWHRFYADRFIDALGMST
jgi:hypothetical protein